jgi:hypothetical protein
VVDLVIVTGSTKGKHIREAFVDHPPKLHPAGLHCCNDCDDGVTMEKHQFTAIREVTINGEKPVAEGVVCSMLCASDVCVELALFCCILVASAPLSP